MKTFSSRGEVFSPPWFQYREVTASGGAPMRTSVRRRARAAFSLVEVVLAIGIVSFAFVGMFGLLPAGLSTFRQAIDNSVGSQIVQRLVNEAQQTDYDPTLIAITAAQPSTRYFNDQGSEVTTIKDSIYTAEVSVATTDKLTTPSILTTPNLAVVTIKLANNPGQNPSPFVAASNVRYATYTALIAKNQTKPPAP